MSVNQDKEKENQLTEDNPTTVIIGPVSEQIEDPIEIISLHPCCSVCSITESLVWSKDKDNNVLCNRCSKEKGYSNKRRGKTLRESASNHGKSGEHDQIEKSKLESIDVESPSAEAVSNDKSKSSDCTEGEATSRAPSENSTKKSTRKSRLKQSNQSKTNATKSKGRRNFFKKCVYESPSSVITPISSDAIYHNGFFFQAGDIVELTDVMGSVYYAQIRGFLQDQYCEKSAVITWLLPTKSSPKDHFDPTTYILGPEEDTPRKLDCMKFVCNCPSDYFKVQDHPFSPPTNRSNEVGFIWTSLGPSLFKKSTP